MELLSNVVYVISFFAYISLGFLVYSKNRNSQVNIFFSWLCFTAAGWILTLYFFYFLHNGLLLLLGRMNFVFTELLIFFAFYFTYWFPKRTFKINRITHVFLITWIIILSFVTLFTNLIDFEEIKNNGSITTVYGDCFFAFFIHFFIFAFLTILIPFLKYKKVSSIYKYQIKYFWIGAIFTLVPASISNIVLPLFFQYFDLQFLGPLFALFFIGSISYSIINHRLMNIQIVLKKGAVFTVSFLTVIILVWIVRLLLLGGSLKDYSFFEDLLIIILTVAIFPPIKDIYNKIANKYFFSSLYDSQKTIASLSRKISRTLDEKEIYQMVIKILVQTLHPKIVGIYKYEEKSGKYSLARFRGLVNPKRILFKNGGGIFNGYLEQGTLISLSELKKERSSENNKSIRELNELKIEILVPLKVSHRIVGLIALGIKESSDPYDTQDIAMLEVIGSQLAVAIQNALSYKEIKDFNIKLGKEVERATRELTVTNKKLRRLDKTKSEFISIASHQLRTPLTSIKGFSSLLVEGSYGKLSREQEETIKKIYISNEKLIMLVEDLLNVSRIEHGKLTYEFQEINIRDLIEDIVKIMRIQAKNRGLYLKLNEKISSVIKIEGDYKKIAEIIGNLVDNAIKYTEKGGVTLGIEKNKKNIKISISDTGIGIDPKEIPKLFEKFSRGEGIYKLHTGGTGLGLYIAKKLTEAHSGTIWIESEGKGKGSTFFVSLPIKQNLKK